MWTLHLLGQARIGTPERETIPLERKSAGLLTYLAWDGPTCRSRLAGLLWPDSEEAQARANLRQTLARLRKAGADVVTGDDVLCLRRMQVDAHRLMARASLRRLSTFNGELRLLSGFDFDDCPEFSAWLQDVSEELRTQVCRALQAEVERCIEDGRLDAAREPAKQLVRLDSFSEKAHRQLISLHQLCGDPGAARQAYLAYRNLFVDELGIEPSEETHQLAFSTPVHRIGGPERKTLPRLRSLRPPNLVGRRVLWERMTQAWEEKKIMVLSGPAGIGKSRLAEEFIRSRKTTPVRIENRPGDACTPYAPIRRGVRHALQSLPKLELPGWVRRELSRIVPEFEEGASQPPPDDDFSKLRFYEAMVEFLRVVCESEVTLWIEDLHDCGELTADLGNYLFFSQAAADFTAPSIVTIRPHALPASVEKTLARLVAQGRADLAEVPPLDEAEVALLLEDLELPDDAELGLPLVHGLGGNPGTILQTLENLLHGKPAQSPRAEAEALDRKLSLLSPEALQLARVAAVAGDSFSLSLASAVLDLPPLRLATPWGQLEDADFLRSGRLDDPLLREALLADLPDTLLAHLYGETSRFLGSDGEAAAFGGRT